MAPLADNYVVTHSLTARVGYRSGFYDTSAKLILDTTMTLKNSFLIEEKKTLVYHVL